MCGRVIIGGVGCSFAELTIQWMNAFINNSWCLALFINLRIGLLEDFNRGQVAAMVESVGLVVE